MTQRSIGWAGLLGLLGLLAGLGMSSSVQAGQKRLVAGGEAAERIDRLTKEIPWLTSLPDALARAKAQGKLVFWVQMLGQISGST